MFAWGGGGTPSFGIINKVDHSYENSPLSFLFQMNTSLRGEKSYGWKMVRLFAFLVRLLHFMIIASALVPFESFFRELELRKVMGGKW